jgi:hypothetical protein
MQVEFKKDIDVAFEGMYADSSNSKRDSVSCFEENGIDFGRVLTYADNESKSARLPLANLVSLVFSADLVAGNTVGGLINNIPFSVPFNTDHDTTMANLDTVLTAMLDVESALISGVANRTIEITAVENKAITPFNVTVVGGATQPSVTIVNSSNDSFCGVSVRTHKMNTESNEAKYNKTEMIPNLRKGSIWIRCEEAFNNTMTPRVRIVDEALPNQKRGMLKISTTNSMPWNDARIVNKGVAGQLAKIEINLP